VTPQTWDARLYDDKHAFVWKHGAALVELLAPKPGERVLDLGCGTGHLTAQIAIARAEVVGIDSDPAMVAAARVAHPGIQFAAADARDFHFAEPFDAVFSNAVLHWVRPPEAVVSCVANALRSGGRFVAEFGGHGNVRVLEAAMLDAAQHCGANVTGPLWYFPSVGEYAGLLEAHGLGVGFAALFDRPTPLEGETGLRNWVTMFGQAVLAAVPKERRDEFFRRAEKIARPDLFRDGVWVADYRRLRIAARRSA
jgi:trans-aconitate methyltransferase